MTKQPTAHPLRIGLTGGIATGKSTVLRLLKQYRIPVISADQIVHSLYETDPVLREAIRQSFGENCITSDGQIDRRALAAIVFSDPAKRKALEALTHERVREAIRLFFETQTDAAMAVAEIPVLFESGSPEQIAASYDEIWLVVASEAAQMKRLMHERRMSRRDAILRLRNQMPLADKIPKSQVIIPNDGTPADLEREIQRLLWDYPAGVKNH